MCRQVALGVDRRRDGVLGTPEGDEEGVALRVDLVTSVCGECRANDALVVGEHLRVAAAELLHERRRALDVGEQEGDRAAGKLRHLPKLGARGLALGSGRYATRTECTGGRFVAAVNQLAPASREPKTSPEVAPK